MSYPNYLIHFNKNHSKANGQFVSGDGDGDGIIDDHHHYSRNRVRSTTATSRVKSQTSNSSYAKGAFDSFKSKDTFKKAAIATAGAAVAVGTAAIIIKMANNKSYNDYRLEADNGVKWIEAGDLYRASAARVVGGDW